MSFNVFACVFLDGADLARLVFQLINTCLPTLLEGSLDDLLQKPDLDWSDPLLKLATDVARGMRYLHMRRFYDEERGEEQSTVIHRDLKPENCLVSEFMTAQLSDFGTSRAKAHDDISVLMTGVRNQQSPLSHPCVCLSTCLPACLPACLSCPKIHRMNRM